MKKGKGPGLLLGAGIAMLVLGFVMFVGGFVVFGATLFGDVADSVELRDDLEAETDVPGTVEVELRAGDYVVLAIGPALTVSTTAADAGVERGSWAEPTVTLTTADGTPVATRTPTWDVLRDTPDGDAASLTAFTLDAPTTVVLATEGGDGAVEEIGIAEETDLGEVAKRYILPTIVFVLGIVLCCIGPFVAIAGGIWLVVRKTRPATPPAYPPGSFGPPYY